MHLEIRYTTFLFDIDLDRKLELYKVLHFYSKSFHVYISKVTSRLTLEYKKEDLRLMAFHN